MSASVDLRRELAACLAMARQAWCHRASQGSNWLTWSLLTLALGIPLVAFPISGKLATAIAWGAGVPLAMLAALWFPLLLSSLVGQNQHTARLVPGSGRRAVAVMLLGSAVISVVMTVLFVLGGGNPLLGFLLTGLVLSMTAAAICAPALSWILYVLVWIPAMLGSRWQSLLPAGLLEILFAVSPLPILLFGTIAVRALYKGTRQPGGLTSLRQRAKVIDMLLPAWLKGSHPGSGFARRLRRDCTEGRIPALLMHGMGHLVRAPSWRFFGGGMLIALLVVCMAPAWVDEYRPVLRAIVPAVLAVLQIVVGATMAQGVYKRQREQELMRLAPRMPGAHLLNAALARSLLLEYGRCWLGSTALALLFLYFLGMPMSMLLRFLAVYLLTLTWANLLLRDYASEHTARAPVAARTAVVLMSMSLTMLAPVQSLRWLPWLGIGVGCLAAGIALAWLRWNGMVRAPAAFPAARMA